jgi:subtilase family serine protease
MGNLILGSRYKPSSNPNPPMNKTLQIGSLVAALTLMAIPSHSIAATTPKPSPTPKHAHKIKVSAATVQKIAAIKKALLKLSPASKVKPTLQWKYGWRDGRHANLIGRASKKSAIPAASASLSSGYAPADMASAYGFDQIAANGDGTGQTIAIVVAYGSSNIQNDLDTFNSQYGLAYNTVSVVYPSGQPTNSDSGWAGETTLDVEWAHAMAPGASIVVVVSPDDSLANMLNAVTYASTNANVVSMSWSTSEFSGQTTYDPAFSVPGVTFVAASGDNGAGAAWPASSTNVLGVGGTTLTYDTNSGTVSEVAWSGSGGGVSTVETIPAYQVGQNINPGRGVPDVSYDGDPYTGVSVYFTDPTSTNVGGWFVFGGTSAGAPQWAALVADRASLGNSGTNSFNAVIYANARTNASTLFNDIVQGWNGYPALVGYDLVTGLGTPVADQVSALTDTLPVYKPIIKHGPGTNVPTSYGSGCGGGDDNGEDDGNTNGDWSNNQGNGEDNGWSNWNSNGGNSNGSSTTAALKKASLKKH